jgi:transglutaminase-like putative cysteine protease
MSMNSDEAYLPLFKFTLKATLLQLKGLLVTILLGITSVSVRSQNFPVSAIPDSLKENADVVIRLKEEAWDIKSAGEATVRKHYVYTILNEKGNYYAEYEGLYNKTSRIINSINAFLYDESGKEIRHYKKKDMEDLPYYDGVSFVNDNRIKKGNFSYSRYPYTVEFEEEDDLNGFMGIGGWVPQYSLNSSVLLSKYSITAPDNYELKYRMLNSKIEPVVEENNKEKIKSYTWQIRNLSAYDEMPFAAEYVRYAPTLLVALGEIDLEGYRGNMTSWNEFGKFYASLQKGRDLLPEETKKKIHELTKGLTDPKDKVAILYSYLQQNSHYVDVSLGIGGWQASEATYVATNKYGDCKALSNFMIAILKEAGVKANAVIIKGGEQDMDFVTDFTYDPFNHIICCVPLEKDTIWLECTDQFLPPGYLSNFTSNRYGLLVNENGGQLVHTPAYLLPDNTRRRKISAQLDSDGNLNIISRTRYQAYCQDGIERMIHHHTRDEQMRILKSQYDLPTYDVISFNYQEEYSKRLPVINEDIQINAKDYAQISGRRIFINPNILSRSSTKLTEDKNRRLDVELKAEYRYIDSVQIAIPAGYELETKSIDKVISSKYGNYNTKIMVTDGKIFCYRDFTQYSGRFPAKDYGNVVKFYNEMYDADHSKIVLVKKSE